MRLHGKIGMMIIMVSILLLLVGCAPTAVSEVEEDQESTETVVEADTTDVAATNDADGETEVDQEESIEEQDEPEEQEESPTTEVASTESTNPETTPATTPETKPEETKPAETKPAETKPAETKPAETKPAETEPAETPAATGFTDGSFTGSGQGYDGGITRVRVNVSGGKIQAIEVVSHEDTPAIAEGAYPKLTQSIIAAQSVEVDTVSGATFSSKGFIQAVKSALQ